MPDNIIIKSDRISQIAMGQAVVEARAQVNGEFTVLSSSCEIYAKVGEVFAGEARYSGRAKFDALILRDGKPECVSAVAEFTDKITSPDIKAGVTVWVEPEVSNCEAVADGESVKLTAVIDARLFAVDSCEAECSPESEGVYCERVNSAYSTVVAEASDTAYISDGISDVKAEEALCSSSRVCLTKVECGENEIKLSGAVYTVVTVRTADGLIATYKIVTPFVKSIEAAVTPDCTAFAYAAASDSSITMTDGDEKGIELAVTLNLTAVALKKCECEAVTDVFAVEFEPECKKQNVKLCVYENPECILDSVDGQLKLDNDKDAADNVLCVSGAFASLSDSSVQNGRVNVEGLVGGDIVYYNAEKSSVNVLPFRIPFSMPLSVNTDATDADVSATVTDVSIRVRRESVFDIKTELAFNVRGKKCEEIEVITSVERGAEIVRPSATVAVHIAKRGETVWQAAKALGCSPERVREQNAATEPYEGGERLINFCGKA